MQQICVFNRKLLAYGKCIITWILMKMAIFPPKIAKQVIKTLTPDLKLMLNSANFIYGNCQSFPNQLPHDMEQ
jgi:hypothetical protein